MESYMYDEQMQIAYQNSLLSEELIKFEPLNPDERQRQEDYPVGLKNIGNSNDVHFYWYSMLLQFFDLSIFLHSRLCFQDPLISRMLG